MLPKLHPLEKTAIDARRAIQRLEIYAEQSPQDKWVVNGTVKQIIEDLRSIRAHIPKELLDVDLKETPTI